MIERWRECKEAGDEPAFFVAASSPAQSTALQTPELGTLAAKPRSHILQWCGPCDRGEPSRLHRIGQGRIFLSPHTPKTSDRAERLEEIWALIKHAHSALLVTVSRDGSLDSRPMGCVQGEFDGRIWFFTFANSAKLEEIAGNDRVLISYAQPSKYEYVSLTGRARISFDKQRQAELWSETFRVWFPAGLDDPELALISVEVEEAKYWTNPASAVTYGWAYLKARLFGARPAPEQVADIGTIRP